MKIKLNNKEYDINEGSNLLLFIQSTDIKPEGIAIAISNTVIPKSQWETTILTEGTEIMLIHAVSGG